MQSGQNERRFSFLRAHEQHVRTLKLPIGIEQNEQTLGFLGSHEQNERTLGFLSGI